MVELFGSDLVKPMHPPKRSPEEELRQQASLAEARDSMEDFAQEQAQGAAALKMPAAVQVLAILDVKQWLAEAKAAGVVVSASVRPDKTDSHCNRVALFRRLDWGAQKLKAMNGRWRVCEGSAPVLLWRETPGAYERALADVHGPAAN